MNQEDLDYQVEGLGDYLLKEGNRGVEFWLNSKGFFREERNYIRAAFGGNNEED